METQNDHISFKEVRDLKLERDVLEKVFFERQLYCDEVAREYYDDRKRRASENLKDVPGEDEKQAKFRIKKAGKDLQKLCVQFGHDAPCPKTKDERVVCRCCGESFTYEELIKSYYRKTRFARMILFDYIKNQPFFVNASLENSIYDDVENN